MTPVPVILTPRQPQTNIITTSFTKKNVTTVVYGLQLKYKMAAVGRLWSVLKLKTILNLYVSSVKEMFEVP